MLLLLLEKHLLLQLVQSLFQHQHVLLLGTDLGLLRQARRLA
jgi:hypothetical protein